MYLNNKGVRKNVMQELSFNIILDYLYRYALTLVICLLGSFTRDAYDTIKRGTRINIMRIFISSIFSSILLCAIGDYVKLEFAIYVFATFFAGLWSFSLLETSFNGKFIIVFLKFFLANIASPLSKALSTAIETTNEEVFEDIKNNDKKPDDNTNEGSKKTKDKKT